MFVQPTNASEKVFVVGRGIPWWGMVMARLNLRVRSIPLNDSTFSALVSRCFGSGIPVGKTVNQTRLDVLLTRNALKSCSVVALETLPKSEATSSEMWVMSSIRLILVAHGSLIAPPPGWSLCRRGV
jgi:hypothetical protein